MSAPTVSFRAHFDGQVIVPDEPVDFPVDAPLTVQIQHPPNDRLEQPADIEIKRRLEGFKCFMEQASRRHGTPIPAEMLRRENIYSDEGR